MKKSVKNILIFLCGDVMTGRGIDQILPHPCNPQLYESFIKDARDYVRLAEQKHSKINYPVTMNYIWGDALSVLQARNPDAKIINLETTITKSDDYWDKGINYRMHPGNIDVFKTVGIDVCTLANNHILDWGYKGLTETLLTLRKANIQYAGAGESISKAIEPATIKINNNQKILIFSAGSNSSGVPASWMADEKKPGIFYIDKFDQKSVDLIKDHIHQYKKLNDIVIFSIHWGSNWGYYIPELFAWFAHELIDSAHVDVVFGHSSHHFRPIEIYHHKPILYGCGDFINDYEGIAGYEEFRSDLTLMYFIEFDDLMKFKQMTLIPMQIKNFRLQKVTESDFEFILNRINQFQLSRTFHLEKNIDNFVITPS